jgi:hypothetical protein
MIVGRVYVTSFRFEASPSLRFKPESITTTRVGRGEARARLIKKIVALRDLDTPKPASMFGAASTIVTRAGRIQKSASREIAEATLRMIF